MIAVKINESLLIDEVKKFNDGIRQIEIISKLDNPKFEHI